MLAASSTVETPLQTFLEHYETCTGRRSQNGRVSAPPTVAPGGRPLRWSTQSTSSSGSGVVRQPSQSNVTTEAREVRVAHSAPLRQVPPEAHHHVHTPRVVASTGGVARSGRHASPSNVHVPPLAGTQGRGMRDGVHSVSPSAFRKVAASIQRVQYRAKAARYHRIPQLLSRRPSKAPPGACPYAPIPSPNHPRVTNFQVAVPCLRFDPRGLLHPRSQVV